MFNTKSNYAQAVQSTTEHFSAYLFGRDFGNSFHHVAFHLWQRVGLRAVWLSSRVASCWPGCLSPGALLCSAPAAPAPCRCLLSVLSAHKLHVKPFLRRTHGHCVPVCACVRVPMFNTNLPVVCTPKSQLRAQMHAGNEKEKQLEKWSEHIRTEREGERESEDYACP